MNRNKNEEWDKLDEFLSKKVMELKVEKITSEEIDVIISKAKAQKRREKYLIAASITVMILLAISTYHIYQKSLNERGIENTTLIAEEKDEVDYIAIDVKQNINSILTSAILDRDKDDLYERSTDVVVVEVKNLQNIQVVKTVKGEIKEKITNLKGYINEFVEDGKTYMIYLTRNDYGEYLLQPEKNAIREYNLENNTVLNNETSVWEDLDSILN